MTANYQKINAKSALKYAFLPGIIPRAKALGGTGFGYLAFLIASVFQGVRILPSRHPFLNSANIGKYSIRAVLVEAANHIEFSRKNIDQIVIFAAVLLSMVLLVLQFVLFALTLFSGKTFAADAPFKSIFVTENPQTDIAFLMLDYVFGIPKLFGSNALGTDGSGVTPFHEGLHDLFQFYNLAMLVVAVLIFMYYVIVVVIETAQTGVPFGRRFSKIYAPFRLIAAVGLLVPLNYGFNASQYITFYAAKLGSSMATNGWILFNETLDNPMGADNASLVAQPNIPDIDGILYFVSVYHACREMYNIYVPQNYLDTTGGGELGGTGSSTSTPSGSSSTIQIKPYVIVNGKAQELQSYTYDQAKNDFGSSDMEVVLGEYDEQRHPSDAGNVKPYCGKMTFSLSNQNPPYYKGTSSGGHGGASSGDGKRGGVRNIEMEYYQDIRRLLVERDNKFAKLGERAAHAFVPGRLRTEGGQHDSCWEDGALGDGGTCQTVPLPPVGNFQKDISDIDKQIQAAIDQTIKDIRGNMDLKLSDDMKKRGWGGAGIWYNRIAEMNGSVTSAIYAVPTGKNFPEVLETVHKQKKTSDTETDSCKTFEANMASGHDLPLPNKYDDAVARATNAVFQYWTCEKGAEKTALAKGSSHNVVLDVIGVVFGINGLFHLYDDTKMDDDTGSMKVHPLAALSSIGKSLLENAIRSMGISIFASFGGGMTSILGPGLGSSLQNISKMFVGIASIGLTAGFILYYILPFMPFIYFFFAVGAWVKSIFEATVGAPLWALAHLRIDGEGFSGRAAAGGYLLIFEIFLRPIVTVFGLIAGIATFGAMVGVMNSIFYLVVANVVGTAPDSSAGTSANGIDGSPLVQLGTIDQFFFTVVYAILVYMMATSCFKMIDMVPQQIMRWMGTGVAKFNDNTGDPAANLTTYTGLVGSQFATPIFSAATEASGAAGSLIGKLAESPKGTPTGKK